MHDLLVISRKSIASSEINYEELLPMIRDETVAIISAIPFTHDALDKMRERHIRMIITTENDLEMIVSLEIERYGVEINQDS